MPKGTCVVSGFTPGCPAEPTFLFMHSHHLKPPPNCNPSTFCPKAPRGCCMKCVQHALLSFCCEPDLGASPTFFTAHAALWGREATLADRSWGPGPSYSLGLTGPLDHQRGPR